MEQAHTSDASFAIFWQWFIDNEDALFTFESDQDRVFAILYRPEAYLLFADVIKPVLQYAWAAQ